MSADSPRILELRRRVHADPASTAFAQLAEEYRRLGNFQDAVDYCRRGLVRHPRYLSARVTLGCSLLELGLVEEAARELETVLESAPDNLTALRAMAEIHQRRGAPERALEFFRRAFALARFDPDLEDAVRRIDGEIASAAVRSGEDRTGGLVDFDALLTSLGASSTEAPPGVERLISAPAAGRFDAAEPKAELPPDPSDPLSQLEIHLRVYERRRGVIRAAETPSAEASDLARQDVLRELEGWLHELMAARTVPSAH